jgi:transcriptional regulator with XRE-family HTH domain
MAGGASSSKPQRRRTPAPKSDLYLQVGVLVRQAREKAGLSQTELGAPYFTRAYVSAVELGKISPGLKSLRHLATRAGVPLRSLIPAD